MNFRGTLFKCLLQASVTRLHCQDEQRGNAQQTRRQKWAPGVSVRAAKDCGHRGDTALGSLQRRRGEEGRQPPSGLQSVRCVWLPIDIGWKDLGRTTAAALRTNTKEEGLPGRLNPQRGVCLGTSHISLLQTTGGPQSPPCDGTTLSKASHLSEPLFPQE